MVKILIYLLSLLTPVAFAGYTPTGPTPVNPTIYPGADIGAQINAAIAGNPQGTEILIPQGNYTQATTIQCPIAPANYPSYIIRGAGRSAEGQYSTGTILTYTGAGDAVNQVVTVVANQNSKGCQLKDLTIDGSGAGASAVGFHFGGTTNTSTDNVTIQSFKKAGIEIENATGMFTERYNLNGSLWRNQVQIYMHCDTGCNSSFEHSRIYEWFNILEQGTTAQEGLLVDGAALVANDDLNFNGNYEGTGYTGGGSQGALIHVASPATITNNTLAANLECDITGGCLRFKLDTGGTYGGLLTSGLLTSSSWSDSVGAGDIFRPFGWSINNQPGYFIAHVNGTLNIQMYGADPTGTIDSTSAIQSTISAACPGGPNNSNTTTCTKAIYIPGGKYKVTQLNMTNLQGLTIVADGTSVISPATFNCTEAANNTGVCVDLSGSLYTKFSGWNVVGVTGNAPQVLVLMAKSTVGVGNSEVHNWDNMTFDQNIGDFGVYNNGGEIWTCDKCQWQGSANIATLMFSVTNTKGITSPFTTLPAGAESVTVMNMANGVFSNNTGTPIMFDTGYSGVGDYKFSGFCYTVPGKPCISDYSAADTGEISNITIGPPFRSEPNGANPGPLLQTTWTALQGVEVHGSWNPTVSTANPAIQIFNTYRALFDVLASGTTTGNIINCTGVNNLGIKILDYNTNANQVDNCPGATREGGTNGESKRSYVSVPDLYAAHLISQANPALPAPTATSCGTSPSVSGNDTSGVLVFGTGTVPSCHLNFSHAYPTTSLCVANAAGQPYWYYVSSNTASGITINGGNCPSGNCSGQYVAYICVGS